MFSTHNTFFFFITLRKYFVYFKHSAHFSVSVYLCVTLMPSLHMNVFSQLKTTAEDCVAIVEACIQSGVMLSVGHVLRYDPVIHKIKV